ncbi:MAG: ATP synthase F0 subunit B [Acidobacteriota bacterium]|nr:ATP synthase F0 subunit B [Acidobacteriota bacterium]
MRHFFTAALIALIGVLQAFAQETPQETAAIDRVGPWKLINFGIFLALLAWFIAKYAPRFFNARSGDIQKAIKDATGLKIEADFRYSDADKKMAGLGAEVERIRAQAKIEMEREHERVQQQTAAERQRIQQNAANEIEALRNEAARSLRMHTAQIALGLAERRLQDHFAHGEPGDLMDDFVRLIERGNN